jgi:hypothetical protein
MNTASVPISWSSSVSCKGCNVANTRNNPVINYQNQQRIWNTVRVDASQYLLNKGALNGYEPNKCQQVNWNQQSDRLYPHIQFSIPSHGNSTKRTLTSLKPGACSPGGIGCDIKHDSYERYLNRIKGRTLKKGYISPVLTKLIACGGTPPFNPAYPMYGGKYYNTQIIPSCKCPGDELSITCPAEIPIFKRDSCYKPGDLIRWKKCQNNVYGEVMSILDPNTLYVKHLDNYGEPKSFDVVKIQDGIKKVDESCFLMKEDPLPNDYFEKSIDIYTL